MFEAVWWEFQRFWDSKFLNWWRIYSLWTLRMCWYLVSALMTWILNKVHIIIIIDYIFIVLWILLIISALFWNKRVTSWKASGGKRPPTSYITLFLSCQWLIIKCIWIKFTFFEWSWYSFSIRSRISVCNCVHYTHSMLIQFINLSGFTCLLLSWIVSIWTLWSILHCLCCLHGSILRHPATWNFGFRN